MNTFLTGREGGTEPDKETVEERQSGEVGSCGCEEACSWCAAVSRAHMHIHKWHNTTAAFSVFTRLKNEELVFWLQVNHIAKERLESPWNPNISAVDVGFIYHVALNVTQVNIYSVD